jgi:ribosome biogenesis GTPase
VSSVTGEGVDALLTWLGPGRTGVFLGSSGVGKSTLVNRLVGEEALATRGVREADSKGRHTTSRRELIVLPGARGLVIDTPGLREIQLPGGEGLAASFPEVEELAAACRFRDCRHEREPGCAVLAALCEGRLDPDRFESYLEQRRQAAWEERRFDERARRAEEGRWRRIAIEQRRLKKSRRDRR